MILFSNSGRYLLITLSFIVTLVILVIVVICEKSAETDYNNLQWAFVTFITKLDGLLGIVAIN